MKKSAEIPALTLKATFQYGKHHKLHKMRESSIYQVEAVQSKKKKYCRCKAHPHKF